MPLQSMILLIYRCCLIPSNSARQLEPALQRAVSYKQGIWTMEALDNRRQFLLQTLMVFFGIT